LHASIQKICDIDAIILVARTENGNGAHLHAVDRFWAKVIVTPSTKDAIIESVLRLSGVDPVTIDRRVTSLRIPGAPKIEACVHCNCTKIRQPKRQKMSREHALSSSCSSSRCYNGRINVGNPFTLRTAVDITRSAITDLSDLPLDVALELTRITWWPEVDC
jgi:hypothetical protein